MDVTDAISQDQVADSLVAEPEETTSETGTEEVVESTDEQPVEEVQEQTEEDGEDWLPSEQEKVFPDEVLLRYAQRYQKNEEWLSDPLNRQLLIDKINTDIWARQQQEQPEVEEKPEEEPQQRPTQQQFNPQQWLQTAQQFVRQNQINNPEIAKEFTKQFLGAFGVNELPQNANPDLLAETFSVFGMNLINTILPMYFNAPSPADGKNMLQYYIESQYEGFGDMASERVNATAWDAARQGTKLPAYGTQEFQKLEADIVAKFPQIARIDKAADRAKLAVAIAQGRTPNPELMKQAVQTGKRLAQQTQSRKQLGNLGAGNSKTQFSKSSGDDDFFSNPESWKEFTERKL